MDKIVDAVVKQTGLPRAQVDKVVDAVMDFLKDNPDQLTQLLGKSDLDLDDVGKKLGGLFGR
ncbi:MAG: hypothetical protein KC482_10140 [Dehalococcoidia bacterium]|nr:hypothetical protein [Dehalococcoidia bacterium]MCA9844739.1 hypothetical protein [Dehalococcoidia bacterium]MCA9853941.1 hypothetical protein [Dehalococcoidia bacterium]